MNCPLRLEQNQGYSRNITGIPVLKRKEGWRRPVSAADSASETQSESSESGRPHQPWLRPLRLVPRQNLLSQGRVVKPVECTCRVRTGESDEQHLHRRIEKSPSIDQIKSFQREEKVFLKGNMNKPFVCSYPIQGVNIQRKCLPTSFPSRIPKSKYERTGFEQSYTGKSNFSASLPRVQYDYPLGQQEHLPNIELPVKDKFSDKCNLQSSPISHSRQYQEHLHTTTDQLSGPKYYSQGISKCLPYTRNYSSMRDGLANSVDSNSHPEETFIQQLYPQSVPTSLPVYPGHLSHSDPYTQESSFQPTKTLSQFVQACFPTQLDNRPQYQMSEVGVQTIPESFSELPSKISSSLSRRRTTSESSLVLKNLRHDIGTKKPSIPLETQQNHQTETSKQQNNRLSTENNISNKIVTQGTETDHFSQNEIISSIGTGGTREKCIQFRKKNLNLPIIPDNPSEKTLYFPYNIEDEFENYGSKVSVNLPFSDGKITYDIQAKIDYNQKDEECALEDVERLIAAETADIEYARAARCREMQNVFSVTTSIGKGEKNDCEKLITPDFDQADSVDPRAAAALVQAEEKGLNLTESPKQFFRKLFPDQEVHEISATVTSFGSDKKIAVPRCLAGISCQQPLSFEDAAMLDFFYNAPPDNKVTSKNINKDGDEEVEELDWKLLDVGHDENGDLNKYVLMARTKESEIGSVVQKRGSKPPLWFAGYFYRLPSSPNVQKDKDPFEVLEWAWKAAIPANLYTKDGVVTVQI